ncbi:MAG: hypothetical protein ACKOEQ_15870, partial [Verrucomicrobiota bacterium]
QLSYDPVCPKPVKERQKGVMKASAVPSRVWPSGRNTACEAGVFPARGRHEGARPVVLEIHPLTKLGHLFALGFALEEITQQMGASASLPPGRCGRLMAATSLGSRSTHPEGKS